MSICSDSQKFDELQIRMFHFCAHSKTHSLDMGLRNVPDLVLTCATRTHLSSLFGQISSTLPKGHEHLGAESSTTRTTCTYQQVHVTLVLVYKRKETTSWLHVLYGYKTGFSYELDIMSSPPKNLPFVIGPRHFNISYNLSI